MKRLRKLTDTGDTIIEVLISIAIVSLVLAVSYGTANHNVLAIQDAQERSQALQIAQRQVELLKINDGIAAGNDCYNGSAAAQDNHHWPSAVDPCVLDPDGTSAAVGSAPAYQTAITSTPAGSSTTYEVAVKWDSLLQGVQQDIVTLYYRP